MNRTRLAREIDTAVAKTGVDVLAERERRAFQQRKLEWSVRDGMDVLTASTRSAHPRGKAPQAPPELARQLCCDPEMIPVVTGRNGEVLDVGRRYRLPTDKQRAAVIARDKTCVGCDAPVSRCQIHHIEWWDRDKGHTDLDNLTRS